MAKKSAIKKAAKKTPAKKSARKAAKKAPAKKAGEKNTRKKKDGTPTPLDAFKKAHHNLKDESEQVKYKGEMMPSYVKINLESNK